MDLRLTFDAQLAEIFLALFAESLDGGFGGQSFEDDDQISRLPVGQQSPFLEGTHLRGGGK